VIRYVYTVHLIGSQTRRLAYILTRGRTEPRETFLLPTDAEVQYSVAALVQARDLCARNGAEFSVAVYRDLDHYDRPGHARQYEGMITGALERVGIPWFILGSHLEHLAKRHVMPSGTDSSPRAK